MLRIRRRQFNTVLRPTCTLSAPPGFLTGSQDDPDPCGLHPTSYTRQERGESRVNLAVYRLLLVMGGVMPWPDWSGWECINGRLYGPDRGGPGWGPADVLRLEWLDQVTSEQRREIARLRATRPAAPRCNVRRLEVRRKVTEA